MNLTSENLRKVFMDCLFNDDEPKDNPVIAEGIMRKFGFHPVRLKENEDNISSMLDDLPAEFQQSSGGGMSFLNACNDKDGNQWADLHQTIEQLVVLGVASGRVKYVMPREMWNALPGGMPYFVVLNKTQFVTAE